MSPNMVGAIIGFAVGFLGFLFIRVAASRVESKGVGPEPVKTAGLLRIVAFVDLAVFTLIGYFVGPMLTTSAN